MFSFQRRPGPLALFCAVLLLLTMLLWPMSRQSSSLPAAGDAAVAVSTDNWGLSFPPRANLPWEMPLWRNWPSTTPITWAMPVRR